MINTASGTIDSYRHPDYTTAVGNACGKCSTRVSHVVLDVSSGKSL